MSRDRATVAASVAVYGIYFGGGERMRLTTAATVLVWAAVTGCQIEWGGGSIALENPAPPPDTTAVDDAEPTRIPLEPGPYLYVAALDRAGGAVLTPIARIGGEPGEAEFLDFRIRDEDPTYRARFDSTFLAAGDELELLTGGERIGTLVLDGPAGESSGSCASTARARTLIVPGETTPRTAFAIRAGSGVATVPRRTSTPAPTNSMQVAGPVLAERLIGGDRAFLAQRMAMGPVRLLGDTLPGMTATYLIADSLAAGPPGEDAVSLFFMARFEPTQGYIPVWQEVRRYGAGSKEAFEHLDWIRLGGQRVDAVRRYDDAGVRLALSAEPSSGDREVGWVEPPGCEALRRLGVG